MSKKPVVKISHIGICTSNVKRSIQFYTEALGFELIHAIDEIGPPFDVLLEMPEATLSAYHLKCGDVTIELMGFPNSDVTGSAERRPMNQLGFTHMTLIVDDIDAIANNIVKYGGKVHKETKIDSPYGPLFFCTDPDGLRIELMQAAE